MHISVPRVNHLSFGDSVPCKLHNCKVSTTNGSLNLVETNPEEYFGLNRNSVYKTYDWGNLKKKIILSQKVQKEPLFAPEWRPRHLVGRPVRIHACALSRLSPLLNHSHHHDTPTSYTDVMSA